MNILALDTAGKTAAVAVMQQDILRYETASNTGLTHSETLLPMVDTALRACGLTAAQIDLYAVTIGPGSFTGLRIGLSAVKGLAFAANTPCAGVSTLAALAWGMAGQGTVVGALDARRGQVYWAGFDLESHDRLTPDAAEPVEAMENFIKACNISRSNVANIACRCIHFLIIFSILNRHPAVMLQFTGCGNVPISSLKVINFSISCVLSISYRVRRCFIYKFL